MEFLVVPETSETTESELIQEFLEYRCQRHPDRYGPYESRDEESISERSGVLYRKVPRDAINYMDVDSYYGIIETVSEWNQKPTTKITNKYKISKIKEIIKNGGKNADLSEESLVASAEEWVRQGPGLLCDFAIDRGHGIKIFE